MRAPQGEGQAGARLPFGPMMLLASATLLQTMTSVMQQGIAVVAVFIRQELHLSLVQMGTFVSASSFGMMLGFTVAGILADRHGPRRLLLWGGALTVLAVLSLTLAHGYVPFLIGFFIFGICDSSVPTSGLRAIFGAFSPKERGLMMGIRQTGVTAGAALAAALIPTFVLSFSLSGLWILIAASIAVTGALFCACAPTWSSPPKERRSLVRTLGQFGPALGPVCVAFLLIAGQWCTLSFTIVDLHTRLGWTFTLAGLGLALVQVGGGIARIGSGWVSDRLDGRRPLVVGTMAFLGALGCLALAWLPRTAGLVPVLAVLFFLGVGAVGWNSVLLTWVGESVPTEVSGQSMSWTGSIMFLGSAIFPPLFGYVVDTTGHFAPAWEGLAVVLTVAGGLAWLLEGAARRRRREGLRQAQA